MRIAIVNDVLLAAEAMRRALLAGTKHEIAWTASNGKEALDRCQADRPDLLLMDLVMPVMDGVEATRAIMATAPCPILIVTGSVNGNTARVFEAMGAGALDAVQTPALFDSTSPAGAAAFCSKVETILRLVGDKPPKPASAIIPGIAARSLIAIGASAGGPAALAVLLRDIPADFPAGIVIIQHVDAHFAPGLASWLSEHSQLPVRLAREGDAIRSGQVLVAGANDHLILRRNGHLGYTPDPADYSYRPSVDVFFHSVARCWRGEVVGVLLTGMGRDGAGGLKALREHGYHTIAQDRASSAVYGMPKAAVELGAASEVLPLDRTATALLNHFTKRSHN
jgi:chemotaxis response regulator CheB